MIKVKVPGSSTRLQQPQLKPPVNNVKAEVSVAFHELIDWRTKRLVRDEDAGEACHMPRQHLFDIQLLNSALETKSSKDVETTSGTMCRKPLRGR